MQASSSDMSDHLPSKSNDAGAHGIVFQVSPVHCWARFAERTSAPPKAAGSQAQNRSAHLSQYLYEEERSIPVDAKSLAASAGTPPGPSAVVGRAAGMAQKGKAKDEGVAQLVGYSSASEQADNDTVSPLTTTSLHSSALTPYFQTERRVCGR